MHHLDRGDIPRSKPPPFTCIPVIKLCVGLRPRGHAKLAETKTRSQRGHRAARGVRLMRRHARRDGDAAADAAGLAAHTQDHGGESWRDAERCARQKTETQTLRSRCSRFPPYFLFSPSLGLSLTVRIFRAATDEHQDWRHLLEGGLWLISTTKADEAFLIGEGKSPIAAYLSAEEIVEKAVEHNRRRDPPGIRLPLGEYTLRRALREGRDRVRRPAVESHPPVWRQDGGARPRARVRRANRPRHRVGRHRSGRLRGVLPWSSMAIR